jgi:hypothetical protein
MSGNNASGVRNCKERPCCIRGITPKDATTKLHTVSHRPASGLNPSVPHMKNILSKENIQDFLMITVAVVFAVIVVIPLVRKFVPGMKKTTTATPAATP